MTGTWQRHFRHIMNATLTSNSQIHMMHNESVSGESGTLPQSFMDPVQATQLTLMHKMYTHKWKSNETTIFPECWQYIVTKWLCGNASKPNGALVKRSFSANISSVVGWSPLPSLPSIVRNCSVSGCSLSSVLSCSALLCIKRNTGKL